MVFALCRDSASIYHCELWMSRRKDRQWELAFRLPEPVNLPDYSSSQPAFGKNGNVEVLYFVSDRPSGKGDDDIWMAEEINGQWKVAAVSSMLNTPGKESSPFWDPLLGVLWFASDWHYGTGGLDIFGYKTGAGVFRLPAPFNTCTNDWGLMIGQERKTAWLTSNRPGSQFLKSATCCNDLWTVSWSDSLVRSLIPPALISETPALVIGNSSNSNNNSPADSLPATTALSSIPSHEPQQDSISGRVEFYFHNDEPDPRSLKSNSSLPYSNWYQSYLAQRQTYLDSSSSRKEEVSAFFSQRVFPVMDSVRSFQNKLKQWAGTFSRLEISLSGFCSPLTGNAYNLRLSERRIQSVLLELESSNPEWKEWIRSGKLIIKTDPRGEESAKASVSDRLDQTSLSVYSTEAANERKVVMEWKLIKDQ
jgi:outer membrane protein OmpA-like peptidoglycan-associated protein